MKIIIEKIGRKVTMIHSYVFHLWSTERHESKHDKCFAPFEEKIVTKFGTVIDSLCYRHECVRIEHNGYISFDLRMVKDELSRKKNAEENSLYKRKGRWVSDIREEFGLVEGPKNYNLPIDTLVMEMLW